MNSTDNRRLQVAGALALALLVALSAFAPAATAIPKDADEIAVEQTAVDSTVAPGDTVEIETTINGSDLNAPALNLTLPEGWELESQSAEGPATFKSSTNEWVWLSGGEYDVTYTVAVPDDAEDGEYDLGAEASAINPETDEFVEDSTSTTIAVATEDEPENQPPTADAGDDQTVEEGDQVTLDATGSDDPDGDDLSYEWTQTDGTDVSLSEDDASSATPSFTAPDVGADETLTFEVEVSDGEETDTDTVDVTVEDVDETDPPDDAPPADVTVEQTASSDTVAPGETVTFDATIDATETNAPALNLTLPEGWELESQSAEGPATFKPSTNEWVWLSGGEYDVTYTVAVPDDAEDGEYDVDAEASAIDPATDEFVEDSTSTTVTVEDADETDPPADDEPTDGLSTEVSLSPESELVAVDDSAEYDIVVEDVDGGVGVYSMTVGVDDPSVASITDVDLAGLSDEELADVQIAEDGSSITIEAVMVDTDDTGSVTLGSVTVESATEGTTDVSLDVSELGDESGNAYEVTATSGASLEASELVVGGSAGPAQDPDGDGVYEDVNGDGEVDVLDVQTLFAERNSDVVQNSPDAFDFNGDGEFSLLDIQKMFAEETG